MIKVQLKKKKIKKKSSTSFADKIKKEKDEVNRLNKLNNIFVCYNQLSDFCSKYSFGEASQLIFKTVNDLFEDEIKNVEPQEELKRIISKVGNKESLFIILFSVLLTKCLLKNLCDDEDEKSVSIKKEEKEESSNKEMAQIGENNNRCQERNENKIDLQQNEMIINEYN